MLSVDLQVSFVGLTEEAAREQATKDGYSDKVAVVKTSFKANSKVHNPPSSPSCRQSVIDFGCGTQ